MTDAEQSRRELVSAVEATMAAAWREPGYTVPNPDTYPHQWLWDSCFHALIWLELDRPDRAAAELTSALAHQDPGTGFVPHMTYWSDPAASVGFWGRTGRSCLTQPPIYGHTAAALVEAGVELDRSLLAAIEAAFRHLLRDRERTAGGLVPVYHPWETGCDDSPRWDEHRRPDRSWRQVKGELVAVLADAEPEAGRPGPLDSGGGSGGPAGPSFVVGSVGFNALVVWCGRRYLSVRRAEGRSSWLRDELDRLASAVRQRWDPTLRTWLDDGSTTGGIRTLDALLCLLVDPRAEAFAELGDPEAFAAPFGPRGVDRREPTYRPDVYWRGSAWPQLTYLLAVAASEAGDPGLASLLTDGLLAGATTSGLSEHWNPESGAGLGARPQSWTGLAIVPVPPVRRPRSAGAD